LQVEFLTASEETLASHECRLDAADRLLNKIGLAAAESQSQDAEVCTVGISTTGARILEPVRDRGGSSKAAGMKRKQYGSYSAGTGIPYHTEWRPHKRRRRLTKEEFMLCEVVRRTNVRRAYGRPPEGSNGVE